MRSKYAWFLLPPILALIVFLGPLQNLNDSTSPANNTKTSTSADANAKVNADTSPAAARRSEIGSQLPQLPNLWQISSTLVGVLLLGVVFLGLFRKLKETSRVTPGSPLVLRQSLRLSAKHHVHAVQYEDQILVLGACDNSISVLCTGENPDVAEDEATIRDRDEEDEGAVPRDMVLPRPDKQPRRLPKQPAVGPGLAEEAARKLSNFRTLLKRARDKAQI